MSPPHNKAPRHSIAVPGAHLQSMERKASYFEARSRGIERQDSGSIAHAGKPEVRSGSWAAPTQSALAATAYRTVDHDLMDRLNEPLFLGSSPMPNQNHNTDSTDSLIQAFPPPREIPISTVSGHNQGESVFQKQRRSIAFAEGLSQYIEPPQGANSHQSHGSKHSGLKGHHARHSIAVVDARGRPKVETSKNNKSPNRRHRLANSHNSKSSRNRSSSSSHTSKHTHKSSERKKKSVPTKKVVSLQPMKRQSSAIQLLFGDSTDFKKTPLCVITWIILTFLLTMFGLILLMYISTETLTYSQSQEWVLDGSDYELKKLSDTTKVKIDYRNIFGTLYIKEHTLGGEYIQIIRDEAANKGSYLSTPSPTMDIVKNTDSGNDYATITIRGPSFWEFIKGAGRRSDWTIYVPNKFAALETLDIYSFNGAVVIDLPSVEPIKTLDIDLKFDLNNIIGAAHIMNGEFESINVRTWKPHLCIAEGEDARDSDLCFADVQRDLRVTTGVRANNVSFSTLNGNFFAHNLALIDNLSDASGTEYKASTLNGLVHFTWSSEFIPDSVTLPQKLSLSVSTTSYKLAEESVCLVEAPTGLLDGFEITGPAYEVVPSTVLVEGSSKKKFIISENMKIHDGTDPIGDTIPEIPDDRKIYLSSALGDTVVRVLP